VPEPPGDAVEVLSGTVGDELRWVVVVAGDDQDLSTMLHIYRGDRRVAGSGFGGPKLYRDSLVNEWRGKTDDLPYFVMARMSPIVDRVIATTDHGSEITLALSPPIARFGLRFAAAALPEGEQPGSLRVEREGIVLEARPQPGPWLGPPAGRPGV
jgi:hypothetical protein